MISYGTKKRRRPLVSLREHGRRSKIFKENRQADKEDNENVTINVEDTETTDKEHQREIDNENIVDIGSPAWVPDSPIYVPPATFSSPDISDDDSVNHMKVTTHTTMEVKTIDSFNPNNIMMICSERDKMKLGGIQKNHPLLFHFNRTLWPVLFATCQLKGLMPLSYDFDNAKHMKSFKLLLHQEETQVLEALRKTYPSTKASNAVDLCSHIVFCVDPRYPTFLRQYGEVKNILDVYSPTQEEQKLIIDYWKSTWME